MKINAHPERMLENILRGGSETFSNAKRMIKELKRDIQGLPSMDYDKSTNLYDFIVRRKTDNTLQYSTRAHPLVKSHRTVSFALIKKQPQTRTLRFGSREGRRQQQRGRQQIRRRSCCCSDCGQDNQKIVHLMYKGATCHRQIEYARKLKEKREFMEEGRLFSRKIARRLVLLRNRSNVLVFRKRCNSCGNKLTEQQQQVVVPRKDPHPKLAMRHTLIIKRQQTINDKLLLMPLKNITTIKETVIPIKTMPTQPSNSSSKILPKKKNRTYIPVTRTLLPQLSPSQFTLSANKSIDEQLKCSVKKQINGLLKIKSDSKILPNTNPYRNISQLDYLLRVRRRQIN